MAIFVVHMTGWKTFFTFLLLHHSEKTPMVDSRCTFLSGWTYDMNAGILRLLIYPVDM